jgi:lipopolysaccharide transport system permease protein
LRTLFAYLLPWRHAGLIRQFAAREFNARYRQSLLGSLWAVLTPLLMLGVYTFVFRVVFKSRWSGDLAADSNLGFALRVYAGLAVFNFFAECVNRAPRLVLDQPHLVKKVVFPLEILPWVSAVSAFANLAIALALLLLFGLWDGSLHATALALPLVWLPLLPLCLGLGWLLAAVGSFIKDVGQVLGLLVSLMMFLSPIFFPVEALPATVQPWLALNPLALPITQTRQVLMEGLWPDWSAWALQLLACCAIAWVGAAFFKAARGGFADVV